MASSFLNVVGTIGRVTINERIEAGAASPGPPAQVACTATCSACSMLLSTPTGFE